MANNLVIQLEFTIILRNGSIAARGTSGCKGATLDEALINFKAELEKEFMPQIPEHLRPCNIECSLIRITLVPDESVLMVPDTKIVTLEH